jgi:hypothetical protein
MLFPVLWSILQALGNHGHVESQWNPITLQGAGLFHLAMGAVLGIAAYGRTQEKLNGAENGGLAAVQHSVTTTYGSPTPAPYTPPVSSAYTPPPAVPAYKTAPTVATSSTGKNMPAPQVDEPL